MGLLHSTESKGKLPHRRKRWTSETNQQRIERSGLLQLTTQLLREFTELADDALKVPLGLQSLQRMLQLPDALGDAAHDRAEAQQLLLGSAHGEQRFFTRMTVRALRQHALHAGQR